MPSVFTQIIKRKIPAHIVAENEFCIAFLDINPLAKGHVLVVPKKEVDYVFDLEDDLLAQLTIFSKKVAHAIAQAIPCKRVASIVLGLEIPHAHIHLIPFETEATVNFSSPKLKLSADELDSIAKGIAKAFAQ